MSLCCCFRRKVNTHNCIHTVEISVTITFMAFPFLQMAALQPPFNCFKSNWNALRQNIERCEYPPLPFDRYSLDVSYIINCCSLFFLFAFKSSLKFRCNTWWDLVQYALRPNARMPNKFSTSPKHYNFDRHWQPICQKSILHRPVAIHILVLNESDFLKFLEKVFTPKITKCPLKSLNILRQTGEESWEQRRAIGYIWRRI